MKRQFKYDFARVPATGAAGGLGSACSRSSARRLNQGSFVCQARHLEQRLRGVDLVITV